MPAAMPTHIELREYLMGAGVLESVLTDAQKSIDLSGTAAAAIADWERDTHWEPFLSSGQDVTLTFSPGDVLYPPNELPMLDLDGGVLSVTSLTVGVTQTNPGTVLTQDTDFFLMPGRAPRKGKPYTYIEFYRANFASFGWMGAPVPNSIVLVGKTGYSLTVPDDVFQSVLYRGAKRLGPQLSAKFGGLTGWSEADAKETYGADPFAAFLDRAGEAYSETVKRYRRVI